MAAEAISAATLAFKETRRSITLSEMKFITGRLSRIFTRWSSVRSEAKVRPAMKNMKLIIGAKIRALREAHQLSQEQLAECINRTPETISNIERGKTMPSLETAQALCNALDIRFSDLFSEEDVGIGPERAARELQLSRIIRNFSDDDLCVAEKILDALSARSARRR